MLQFLGGEVPMQLMESPKVEQVPVLILTLEPLFVVSSSPVLLRRVSEWCGVYLFRRLKPPQEAVCVNYLSTLVWECLRWQSPGRCKYGYSVI